MVTILESTDKEHVYHCKKGLLNSPTLRKLKTMPERRSRRASQKLSISAPFKDNIGCIIVRAWIMLFLAHNKKILDIERSRKMDPTQGGKKTANEYRPLENLSVGIFRQ